MGSALILARALARPETVLGLDDGDWQALLTIAHHERLLASLAHRVAGLPLPETTARILEDARTDAGGGRTAALWEAEMARRALAPLGIPVILLKGTAYVAAGLAAGQGRLIGDLDILVPRDRIDEAEAALLAAGWDWVKPDPYDDAYYRRWMHELPPLIHRDRDRMIDVHHTILPLTARIRPDAAALIADAVPLGNGLSVLAPNDMILHAVAHMLADGDLAGGLRNLWDIDRLIEEFGTEELADRAKLHGLTFALRRALRLRAVIFGPSPSGEGLGWGLSQGTTARLLARDHWGRETRPLLRFAFYLRSHWLRMPPLMLARHLWTKWRTRPKGAA